MSPTLTEQQGVERTADAQRRAGTLPGRAWRWSREHPPQAVSLVAGFVAFVRLLAVSRFQGETARALLLHADLTQLAGGLVVSASMLWIPAIVGMAAYAALSQQSDDDRAVKVDFGLALASLGGIFLVWHYGDLDINRVAQAGRGISGGAALFGVLIGAIIDGGQRADVRSPPPAAPAQPAAETPVDSGPASEPDTPPPSPEPTPVNRWQRIKSTSVTVARVLWAGFWILWLFAMILVLLAIILSEPSQPPENLTVRHDGIIDTRTVHVIDDDSDEWIVMLRDDRTIVSIDANQVIDRYVCRAVDLDPRINRAVQIGMIDPMRTRTEPPAATDDAYDAAEVVRRAETLQDDIDRGRAEEWVRRVGSYPPPCGPEWTSTEMDAVRRQLGRTCSPLGTCHDVAADG